MARSKSTPNSNGSANAAMGQVAQIMAGADVVEIKATIPAKQITAALQHYRLKLDDGQRFVYFFDTPDLKLFKAGVIGRARRVVGGAHDSTIKFRPVNPDEVPGLWRKYSGFKIEADASDRGVVKSASLTMPVPKGLIKKVAAGKAPIAELFTEEQQLFLLAMAEKKFDYSKVVMIGPIQTWRWKYEDPGLPWPVTAELWQRSDKARLLEVSIKVPVEQAACATAGFMAFLAEVGAERDPGQQAKTKWALESPPKRPTATKSKTKKKR
jgi:hypothetical protein